MRLIDFLISLLKAHAGTLQRLAALHGEERLVEMLEASGEQYDPNPRPPDPLWFGRPAQRGVITMASAYAELESAVHEFNLPATLEFHLWAYPHYRAFIESPLDLNSPVAGSGPETAVTLVDEAVMQAQAWIKKLPVTPDLARQTETAAHVAWLRFRTDVLQRIGRRRLDSVNEKPIKE